MNTNICSQIYSISKGEPFFDWNEFLSKESFTSVELTNANILASNWATCACGNKCKIIPRLEGGAPIDRKLNILGRTFHYYISNMFHANEINEHMSKNAAKEILKEIEIRSIEIINEIEGKNHICPAPETIQP